MRRLLADRDRRGQIESQVTAARRWLHAAGDAGAQPVDDAAGTPPDESGTGEPNTSPRAPPVALQVSPRRCNRARNRGAARPASLVVRDSGPAEVGASLGAHAEPDGPGHGFGGDRGRGVDGRGRRRMRPRVVPFVGAAAADWWRRGRPAGTRSTIVRAGGRSWLGYSRRANLRRGVGEVNSVAAPGSGSVSSPGIRGRARCGDVGGSSGLLCVPVSSGFGAPPFGFVMGTVAEPAIRARPGSDGHQVTIRRGRCARALQTCRRSGDAGNRGRRRSHPGAPWGQRCPAKSGGGGVQTPRRPRRSRASAPAGGAPSGGRRPRWRASGRRGRAAVRRWPATRGRGAGSPRRIG